MLLRQACLILFALPLIHGQADGDWFNNWGVQDSRTNVGPFSTDSRATFRGSGRIDIGNGVMTMTGNPRFYVSNTDGPGWKNVEITGYATWNTDGTDPDPTDGTGLSNVSGFHLAARSSHDLYGTDGCEAFGYYALLRRNTGQCTFSKEYYHDVRKTLKRYLRTLFLMELSEPTLLYFAFQDDGNGVLYGSPKSVNCLDGGIPVNVKIGMKFSVTTIPPDFDFPGSPEKVQLRLYLDMDNSGSFVLMHEYEDQQGAWPANDPTKAAALLPGCSHSDGDIVSRAGNVCFFRCTGWGDTQYQWEDAYILNELTYCSDNTAVCLDDSECCSGHCSFDNDPTTNDAGACTDPPLPSSTPSSSPTGETTSSPTGVPTSTPVPPSCTLAAVGDSCSKDDDCCSDKCSNGKPSTRVCLA